MMRKNPAVESVNDIIVAVDHNTKSEVGNNHNNGMLVFLFSVIGLSLLSLSVLATMANAQTSSNSTLGTNSTSNETGVKQMGICQIGVKSSCNGDSNLPR
jgi:hypothetical protein